MVAMEEIGRCARVIVVGFSAVPGFGALKVWRLGRKGEIESGVQSSCQI